MMSNQRSEMYKWHTLVQLTVLLRVKYLNFSLQAHLNRFEHVRDDLYRMLRCRINVFGGTDLKHITMLSL